MPNERFSWSRADKSTAAFELRKRQVVRNLTKDSDLYCLICEKRPKRHDTVYYPASGLSETNKIIAHRTCVDELCASHKQKITSEYAATTRAKSEKQNIIPMADVLSSDKFLASPEDLLTKIDELLNAEYERGRRDGIAEVQRLIERRRA